MTTLMKPGALLRQRLAQEIVVAPGAYDGLSARLVAAAGFSAVYASGGAIARAAGYPDIGLLSFTEVMDRVEKIVDAGGLPVVADADTGFGGSANVERTVRIMERAGVAAFHIEDQSFPKRCGHLDDKTLVDVEEMCRKVHIARQTLADADTLVIARTDAIAVEGFDAAIARAERYVKAGADMIFVEAPETLAQIRAIAERLPGLKLINMFHGGKTPLVPLPDLAAMGYRLAIIPSDLQRAAIHAMQATLAAIRQSGDSRELADRLTSFKEREEIVQTRRYLALDAQSAPESALR
ncbi:2,3-dimethylmalate lyase [compost metagenome]|uniref:isocitrate lyase/PEP mutase family protein n=1 Tax=Achromobacter sp. Root83 TaxID=1736602 RepID=UPI000AA8FCC1|nr:isocitrate lyase/phosphoenolpyruvate mutase family protein [Achromobacter sp. Root83]